MAKRHSTATSLVRAQVDLDPFRKYLDSFNEKRCDYRARVLALQCAKDLPALLEEVEGMRRALRLIADVDDAEMFVSLAPAQAMRELARSVVGRGGK